MESSDFHPFGLKKPLGGQKFATDASIKQPVTSWLQPLDTNFFNTWVGYEHLCHGGIYA
jgi:hypothetical protein